MTDSAERHWYVGHEPLTKRLNVRAELKRYSLDPLYPLLLELGRADSVVVLQDEFSRYRETYACFVLALQRFLPEMSLAVRWARGPYYKRKYGGKYTPSERKLADAYNRVAPYLHLDYYACILWARVLLDRTASLSRYLLTEKNKPSFTSFADHKRFFSRLSGPYGLHEEYASYVRSSTSWFDEPLKLVRDKFIVHASPQHMRIFGYPGGGHELNMMIMIPDGDDEAKPLSKVRLVSVGIPQMAREVHAFLAWFGEYGVAALRSGRSRRPAV